MDPSNFSLSLSWLEGLSIGLATDQGSTPNSADNFFSYTAFYMPIPAAATTYTTQFGVFLLRDEAVVKAVCIGADGGSSGIHPRCALIDEDALLVCCGNSIFCLRLPDLALSWVTIADGATCFGIYRYDNSYLIHGELCITRLTRGGTISWQYSGSDIFTTLDGAECFILIGDTIEAVSWDGRTYTIDARSGRAMKT